MEASLSSFIVDTFNPASINISWSFDTIPAEAVDVELYVSENPGIDDLVDYTLVTTLTINDTDYSDISFANLQDHNRSWYYKFRLVDRADNTNFLILPIIPVTGYDTTKDYVAKRILELKAISLDRFTQRTFYLLKRRTWGEHCSVCWDETLQRCTDPNCVSCDGTGWEQGYFNQLHFKGMKTSTPTSTQIAQFGEWQPGNSIMYSLNFPIITARDVIVDDKGIRWLVLVVNKIEKLGRLIEQQSRLTRLMPDDIAYGLTITKNEFNGLKL